jgi:PilZ domain-containing protein
LCGQTISFWRHFSDAEYCCEEHRQQAKEQTDQLALSRLKDYVERLQEVPGPVQAPEPSPIDVGRERRAAPRVATVLEVRYRVFSGGTLIASGRGRTVNMSNTGILFTTEGRLAEGDSAELLVAWPTGLRMIVGGRLVRCQGAHAAIACRSYKIASPPGRAQSA